MEQIVMDLGEGEKGQGCKDVIPDKADVQEFTPWMESSSRYVIVSVLPQVYGE